ncbi:MAG: NDP-sugar synthase [Polyangiaceae bacterium]|nr:NDP-sugar synthase [Polyangiaceae bacterium]
MKRDIDPRHSPGAMVSTIVLCAGFGTRLLPLTRVRPKPLLPVGDRPALSYIASALFERGVDTAVVNLHHMVDVFLSELEHLPFNFQAVVEPEIRGTAGGIAGARSLLGPGPVVAWVGDVLARPDLGALVARAGGRGICLAVAPRPAGQGTVGRDARGCIVRLRGERFGLEVAGGDYIGVCGLGPGIVQAMPERGCLVGDVFLPVLRRGESIATLEYRGKWSDIGDRACYLAANLDWLDEHHGGGSWVGPDVNIGHHVRTERCVVGRGARVDGYGSLVRCVVWPGATARAPLSDVVIADDATIVRAL